ncbi:MAG: hypothetical protein WBP72_14955 [Rhodocyclaceae bacterium]
MRDDLVPLVLTVVSGVCWTIVYVEGIRVGLRDRSYAMPFWALALNFAWEVLHSVVGYQQRGLDLQIGINGLWGLLDCGILYTYFRYGRAHFPAGLPGSWFAMWALLGLLTAFLLQYAFIVEFGLLAGRAYAAFPQNLLMSVLFIAMLVQRRSSVGQSMTIAVSKWVGTLAPTILFGVVGGEGFPGPSPLILVTGLLCSVFDLIYVAMLARVRARERSGEPAAAGCW